MSQHYQKDFAGKHDRRLRPWDEVARLFTERTGKRMTRKNAVMTANRAMIKIRRRLGGMEVNRVGKD